MPRPGSIRGNQSQGSQGSADTSGKRYIPENISATGLNDLIEEVMSETGNREGGGFLYDRAAVREFSSPIKLRSHVTVVGERAGTLWRASDTFDDTDGSALVINGDDGDRRFGMRDVSLEAPGLDVGLFFNTPDVEGDEYADGTYLVDGVEVFDAGQDAFLFQGRGAGIITGTKVRDCGRYAYNSEAPDNVFAFIESGGSGSAGFRLAGANTRVFGYKMYYSGVSSPATGYGIWADGTDGSRNSKLIGGEVQDTNNDGIYIDGYSRLTIEGLTVDGANAGHNGAASQSASGIHVRAASGVFISGAKCLGRPSNAQQQQYAIEVETSADGLDADIFSSGNAAGHILMNPASITKVDIRINNEKSLQTISNAASITPDLTNGHKMVIGPIAQTTTIANPATANFHYGDTMVIEIRQDGTGGRAVTWGSHFKLPSSGVTPVTTAGFANIYTFMRVSSGWVLTGFIAGIDLN